MIHMIRCNLFLIFILRMIIGTVSTDIDLTIHFADDQILKLPKTHQVFNYFMFFKTKLKRHNSNNVIDLKNFKIETFDCIYKLFCKFTINYQEFYNNLKIISFTEFQDILSMIDYLDIVKVTGYDTYINSFYESLGELLSRSISDKSFELTVEKIENLSYDKVLLNTLFEKSLLNYNIRILKNCKNFTITEGFNKMQHSDIYIFSYYKDLQNSNLKIMELISWFGKALNLSEIILLDVFTYVGIILFDKVNFDNLSTEVVNLADLINDLELEFEFKNLVFKDLSLPSIDYHKISSLDAVESISIDNKQSGIENLCSMKNLKNLTITNSTFDIKDLLHALEKNSIKKLILKDCKIYNLENIKIEDISIINITTLKSLNLKDCEMIKIENLINELIKKQNDLDKFSIVNCNFGYVNEEKVITSYHNDRLVNGHESDFIRNLIANLKKCLNLKSLTIIGILTDSCELDEIRRFKKLHYLCLSVYSPEPEFYSWFKNSCMKFINFRGNIYENEIQNNN